MGSFYDKLSCELMVTSKCNMSCSYCIARNMTKSSMTLDTGKKALDLFFSMSEGANLIEIIFTGGEPLLESENLFQLTSYAKDKLKKLGINVAFILKTNGLLITNEIIKYIKDNDISVVLSLDGVSNVHDKNRVTNNNKETHSIIIKNLKALLKNKISCTASFTVHPHETDNILTGVQYLSEIGVEQIDIGPAYGTVNWTDVSIRNFITSMTEVAKYLRQVRLNGANLQIEPLNEFSEHVNNELSDIWGCDAAVTKLAFLPDGTISGCSSLAMIAKEFPNLIIGDIFTGIDETALENLQNECKADFTFRKQCKDCQTASNCIGGCIAINYAANGNPYSSPSFYCQTIDSISTAWKIAWNT